MNEGEGGELYELIVNLATGESKPEHLSAGSYINDVLELLKDCCSNERLRRELVEAFDRQKSKPTRVL